MRPLSRLYDKNGLDDYYPNQGSDDIRTLINSTDVTLTFTFPQHIIVKNVFTFNNSRESWNLIINNKIISTRSGYISLPDSLADSAKNNMYLPYNNEISNVVQVRLKDGTRQYTQNSEFYFYGYPVIVAEPEPSVLDYDYTNFPNWTNVVKAIGVINIRME